MLHLEISLPHPTPLAPYPTPHQFSSDSGLDLGSRWGTLSFFSLPVIILCPVPNTPVLLKTPHWVKKTGVGWYRLVPIHVASWMPQTKYSIYMCQQPQVNIEQKFSSALQIVLSMSNFPSFHLIERVSCQDFPSFQCISESLRGFTSYTQIQEKKKHINLCCLLSFMVWRNAWKPLTDALEHGMFI